MMAVVIIGGLIALAALLWLAFGRKAAPQPQQAPIAPPEPLVVTPMVSPAPVAAVEPDTSDVMTNWEREVIPGEVKQ